MILILGGTSDGARLTDTLFTEGYDVMESLSGVTAEPRPRDHPTRTGGFGGADGLLRYITDAGITALIDATHPYAKNISWNACAAASRAKIPMLRFERPAWTPAPSWTIVGDYPDAADALPTGARAFLTVGGQSLNPFADRADVWFLFRAIDAVANPFTNGEAIIQRPPHRFDDELALMQNHRITHLVTKNSGGDATFAKIEAATYLSIPIIVIERPVLPVVETVTTVSDVTDWLARLRK